MDSAELLARARRYRKLAVEITDEQAKRALLDLAEKYEALAKEPPDEEGSEGG